MNKIVVDAGIPLLTEVIPAPQARSPLSVAPVVNPPTPSAATPAPQGIEGWVDGEWSRLERQISERVLQQMLGNIDFVLEQHVRDSLADVLQTAVERLAGEIREGLQQSLEEVISRAVSQEIAKLQTK